MKHKTTKLWSVLLSLMLMMSLIPAFNMTALADGDTTSYTLTIPSALTVADKGWNATDGISATGALASGKKLTVTASSANSWALKQQDGSETVGYTMKETADGAAKTAWEFTELSNTATTKPMGIIVDDYSSKPAGTYQDTVTFTASVVSASVPVTAITLNKTETTIYKVNGTATETLSVSTVTPDNATDKTVTWSSDKESVATVDTDGKVTAVAAGTAHIRATANDGSGVYGECTVTVSDLSAYYSKMVECGCDDLEGKCYNGANPENGFTGQVLSAAQAIALAQAKAAETSSNCAVFYDNGSDFAEIKFAKNDGTTGSAQFYYRPDDKGLTGYRGFYVSK